MNEIAQQVYEEERDILNQNCPSGHIVNLAHKREAFGKGEKRCHYFGNTQNFRTVAYVNHWKKL